MPTKQRLIKRFTILEITNLLEAQTREELKNWLIKNSLTEKCCWVVVSLKPKANTVLYLDAVEEAICFGWIDGIKKKISDTQLAQRLSPRIKGSKWTELNKERARRLDRLGLMTDEGRKSLPDMRLESFQIDPIVLDALRADEEVYANFLKLPPLYQKIRIDNIQSQKKLPELFDSRLSKFIEFTKLNKMYGDWNDNGRLINE